MSPDLRSDRNGSRPPPSYAYTSRTSEGARAAESGLAALSGLAGFADFAGFACAPRPEAAAQTSTPTAILTRTGGPRPPRRRLLRPRPHGGAARRPGRTAGRG